MMRPGVSVLLAAWTLTAVSPAPLARAEDTAPAGLPSTNAADYDVAGARTKVTEELGEVDRALAAGDAARVRDELGDLLFAVVNVARKAGVDPEQALLGTNDRFARRFAHVEDRLKEQGRAPKDATLAEMDALWDEAKARERA